MRVTVMSIYLGSTLYFITFRPNFSFHGSKALVDKGLLIVEFSRSHSDTYTKLGRTPLDELSAHRRDLYLTTHNNHTRGIFIRPAGFEPTIPASERS